jgi:hypothetical protein
MSSESPVPSIEAWIQAAPNDAQRTLRQAIHTILVAVAQLQRGGLEVVMKGGVLLAVGYAGDRYTRDVDYSIRERPGQVTPEWFREQLSAALAQARESLPYGLDLRVQRSVLEPPGPNRQFQTLGLTVGYAHLDQPARHRRLAAGQSPEVVSVDLSYNEVITASEILDLGDGLEILASTLVDVVAEKYRALIQQPLRNRVRRQDAYDLHHLLRTRGADLAQSRTAVLEALRRKAGARDVPVSHGSLRAEGVERASRAEYGQLANEISVPLPPFDDLYEAVRGYYESLPWT